MGLTLSLAFVFCTLPQQTVGSMLGCPSLPLSFPLNVPSLGTERFTSACSWLFPTAASAWAWRAAFRCPRALRGAFCSSSQNQGGSARRRDGCSSAEALPLICLAFSSAERAECRSAGLFILSWQTGPPLPFVPHFFPHLSA